MVREYAELREGHYYVAGTRVSLDSLVYAFRRGDSPETINRDFALLRLEEVYGAIAFYLANQPLIDAYLIGQEERWAEGRRTSAPLPSELSEKLARARGAMPASRTK